jgi:flavorubredoxin
MHPVEIKKDIHWVGAVDWNIRDFHGYTTLKGTTYNAFLALDEKITLFDTVKKDFVSDLYHRVHRLIPPEKIDYLVINHVEPDHSSALPEVVERVKPEKIFCSPMGHKNLLAHYHRPDWPYQVVKSGESIKLGRLTVTFLETRMLHWPDSMFSYVPEEKLLISSDAFGEHWATSTRFDDQVDPAELMRHCAKYYGNILLLYSPLVQKLLAKVAELKLDIDMIAPDHGVIWRKNPGAIVAAYDRWSRQETRPKAVIVYDTMWHSTEKMGEAIMGALVREGVEVHFFDLKVNHRSEVMTEVLDAKAIVLGSPTLNNGMMPLLADFLHYLKGLRPAGRIGAAFGSYGWSGESLKIINAHLEEMGVKVIHPGVKINFVPDHDSLRQCTELGLALAKAIKEG